MFKKFLYGLMLAMLLFVLIFCAFTVFSCIVGVEEVSADVWYEPLTVSLMHHTYNGHVYEIVNNETGVCYMLIKYGYGSSITPMYNQNGTLKIKR